MQFAFDVETLGIESNSIVLSAAIIYFDLDERPTLKELIDRALFVKFDAVEQKKAGRSITPSTLTWWKEQHEYIRKLSFAPRDDDYSMVDGIEELRKYVTKYGNGKGDMMWARGGLDQMAIESLARTAGVESFHDYNAWMDIRTALRCLKGNCNDRGYVHLPDTILQSYEVTKHHPRDDTALDIMMILHGE